MRCKSLVLALTALGGIASAQPGPPPQPPPPPVDTTTTTTTTTTDVAPVDTQPQPQPAPQPIVTETAPVSIGGRPDGLSIALGFGYVLPTSLQTPNITSARLRLASGLTFEPLVRISNETSDEEMGGVEATDKHTVFQLAALGRLQLISRGKVDLELLGTVAFINDKDNPDMDFNTTTINSFGVGWGLAVAYWFNQHWNLTMNVTNDLFTYSQTKRQTGPGGMAFKESTTEIGVIFEPRVFMMLHLYN